MSAENVVTGKWWKNVAKTSTTRKIYDEDETQQRLNLLELQSSIMDCDRKLTGLQAEQHRVLMYRQELQMQMAEQVRECGLKVDVVQS